MIFSTHPLKWLIPLLLCLHVKANLEKIVFIAPEAQAMPSDASIDNLLLTTVSQSNSGIRTFFNASFPTAEAAKGTESWMLLQDLNPGQRYEVRVSWIAIQPTHFWLYKHTMDHVVSEPDLLSSLTTYSMSRHGSVKPAELESIRSRAQLRQQSDSTSTTFLFLQIFAKADYFTLNKTVMENVPPVQVDVILDPYLLNIFPTSLIPTAGYLVAIAITGWFMSGFIIKSIVRPLVANNYNVERKRRR